MEKPYGNSTQNESSVALNCAVNPCVKPFNCTVAIVIVVFVTSTILSCIGSLVSIESMHATFVHNLVYLAYSLRSILFCHSISDVNKL